MQFLVHAARSFLTHGDPAYCDTICDPLPPDPAPDEPLPPEPDLPASFVNRDGDAEPDDGPDDGDGGDGGAPVDDGGPDGDGSGTPAEDSGPDGDNGPPAADQPADTTPVPSGPPTRHGRPVALHVVWDLTSLLGRTDHCALLRDSGTMLPPSAMRDLLHGGGRIRRMVIDPETGEQLDLTPRTWLLPATDGRAHRQPVALTLTTTARWDDLPDDLRAAVDAWSGIGESAQGAKRPSRSRHSRGASTERPHRIKTFTNWTVRQIKRRWEWTSPTGRKYTIEPHDYRLGP